MRMHKFDLTVSCACLVLLGYFAWHAFDGPRGLEYRRSLAAQENGLSAELATIVAKRTGLEARVMLLRPGSVDPDMLEEMARLTLGVAKSDEMIVILDR